MYIKIISCIFFLSNQNYPNHPTRKVSPKVTNPFLNCARSPYQGKYQLRIPPRSHELFNRFFQHFDQKEVKKPRQPILTVQQVALFNKHQKHLNTLKQNNNSRALKAQRNRILFLFQQGKKPDDLLKTFNDAHKTMWLTMIYQQWDNFKNQQRTTIVT